MGVYDESLVEPLSRVMTNLGVKRGMVVYGQDKLDEISMSAPTTVCDQQRPLQKLCDPAGRFWLETLHEG